MTKEDLEHPLTKAYNTGKEAGRQEALSEVYKEVKKSGLPGLNKVIVYILLTKLKELKK